MSDIPQTPAGLVTYEDRGPIAIITMDDGKVNSLGPAMQRELFAAFDQAEEAKATVVFTGRAKVFSGGFDLQVIASGGDAMLDMVDGGFALARRLLSFPRPVVIACNGHAIAMGFFLLQSADYRVCADGPFRFQANEVAIGMTMPRGPVEICRQRLTPAALHRGLLLAEAFTPQNAVITGVADQVVPHEDVLATAIAVAESYQSLHLSAIARSKRQMRADFLVSLDAALAADRAERAAQVRRS